MNTQRHSSWWTNKRLVWFTFWTLLFGIAFLLEEQHIYDTSAIYRVQSYRGYRGGSMYPVGDPRTVSGDELAQSEISRITVMRVIGILWLVAAAGGVVVIFGRTSRGEPVFREAFRKGWRRPNSH